MKSFKKIALAGLLAGMATATQQAEAINLWKFFPTALGAGVVGIQSVRNAVAAVTLAFPDQLGSISGSYAMKYVSGVSTTLHAMMIAVASDDRVLFGKNAPHIEVAMLKVIPTQLRSTMSHDAAQSALMYGVGAVILGKMAYDACNDE